MNTGNKAAPQPSVEEQIQELKLKRERASYRADIAKDIATTAVGLAVAGFFASMAYRTFTAPDEALHNAATSK